MSELNDTQLDELAKRIAAQLQSQEEAKANENPNAYLLDVLGGTKPQNQGLSDFLVNRVGQDDE